MQNSADDLRRQAEAAIRQRILTGELAFGERLSDRGLAAALGISRTPVREAFGRLARAGLITVRPQSQGRGLGLQLLEHLMQRARQLGAGECFLEVRASNQSAYRLYERYGFNEVGRRRDYYPAAGGREDALVMACTLFD